MYKVIPAVVIAALHGAVSVTAQACAAGTAQQIDGNWYCSEVKAITYSNFPGTGSYDKITNMDPNTGQCTSEKHAYSGSLAPMSEELSMHFRGPTLIKQLAVYYPGSDAKVKRSDNVHAHAHRHGQQHVHHPRRDHALAGRAVGDMVVATIDGQVVSWVNKYAGPGAGPSTAAAQPLPVAQTTLATSFGTPSQAPSSTTTSASSDPINPLPHAESSSGGSEQWARQAYFNADAGSSEGFTFLNHFGGTNGMPGTADGGPAFGASLSFASPDGKSAAASAQTLGNNMIEDDVEIIVMSDKTCEGDSCGYTRPGGVAYHGFGGDSKLFLMEFSMPRTGKTGFNADMPAIWLLNAQIPLTSQYGTNPKCSCWTSGCGEFDLFEILNTGNFRCKSTLHMAPAGGSSDYFQRPEKSTIKAAVLFQGANKAAHIKILDNNQSFDESLAADVVEAMAQDSGSGGQSSVFRLANS
ncbi:target of Sbf [Xanthoria calcicola]